MENRNPSVYHSDVDTRELTAKRKGSQVENSGCSSEKLDLFSGTPSDGHSQEDQKFGRNDLNLDSRARESIRWFDKFEFANKD